MTRAAIARTISQMPETKYRIIHVKCRPPEKSDQVLVVKVAGKNWYCERPKYLWSAFDRSFIADPYSREEKLLYPRIKEPLGIFDSQGRWWTRQEMSSFGLVDFFLAYPSVYLEMMARHTVNVETITRTLKRIAPTLKQPKFFAKNLRHFIKLYDLMYEAQGTIYTTFDELAWQFRELLLKYLPKETVNIYFPRFLSGEATREALKKGYVKERGALEYSTTRGLLYGAALVPRAFYVPPHYFPDFPEDAGVIKSLIENRISSRDLQKFFAFRMIVPLGFQINEESQYVETAGLSAHLGALIKAVSKKIRLPLEKFQDLSITGLLNQLTR